MIALEPIGYVHNNCRTSCSPEFIKREISEIELFPEYAEGLYGIEQHEYLDLVFALHREKRTELIGKIRTGEIRGVFASRSPKRPNHIGVTTVKLKRRDGNRLYVEGADALDNSPVLDIKCCDTSLPEGFDIHTSVLFHSPRIDLIRQIMGNDTRSLLLGAARFHGHVCPGLAIGVMGAVAALQQLYRCGEDPGDYLLVAGMESCPLDGLLFVTGCTPGTGRFIQGKEPDGCFYLKNREGRGWRITLKASALDSLREQLPEELSAVEKAKAVLLLDPAALFSIEGIG